MSKPSTPLTAAPSLPGSEHVWYRSLYWRIGIGFIAFLALLLLAQAAVFVWLAGRTAGAFPTTSSKRLADLVAADIRDQLERDPAPDLGAHITREYRRVVLPFVVVMTDGRVFTNREGAPPRLLRNARGRLARLIADPPFVWRRRPPNARIRGPGRLVSPIVVDGRLVGLVTVPPGPPSTMAVFQPLGPSLAVSGMGLLLVGAGAAALLIFGPVRRRLVLLQDAAARLGAGDVQARAPEHGGDEVAALARSFNRMATDLQERAAALAAADQTRRQLLADVSHELMTPLTAMSGYLETLAMAEVRLDATTRERYLQIVNEETGRLKRIIGDLLDLARLEGTGLALKREVVDVRALFERVAARHERESHDRGVRLTRRLASGAGRVIGDPDRLEQALQNLASNGLRHTPRDGELALSAEPAGRGIRITVRDTGPGIAPEHVSRIFERFYKADAARTSSGSGLGLSIVKAIVDRHAGSITAYNDNGAVFEIVLPAFER